MGSLDPNALLIAAFPAAAAVLAGWLALRKDKLKIDKPDWPSYATELRESMASMRADLEQQDQKIDDLYAKLGTMREELYIEQRRSHSLLAYLRRFIAWWRAGAVPPPPVPPADLASELSDLWGDAT